jgi:ribose transport system permease protein
VTFTDVFGARSLLYVPVPVWWALLVVLLGIYVTHRTVYGRWVYATGGNRGAATYSGIKTKKVVMIAFIISGFLAAFGGLLLAGRSAAGDPTVGVGMELSAIAAVILGGTDLFGGRGTVLGTVIGALFLGVVGIGLILLGASAQLQSLITGGIIIGAVTINRLGRRD